MMTGIVTPTPVRAAAPTPGIWPIYIRSTMLYITLITCAAMAGIDSRKSSFPTLSVPSSFSFPFFGSIYFIPFKISSRF